MAHTEAVMKCKVTEQAAIRQHLALSMLGMRRSGGCNVELSVALAGPARRARCRAGLIPGASSSAAPWRVVQRCWQAWSHAPPPPAL